MPTGGWDGSVRVYEEDDKVDEKLLNQLSNWILYNWLPWRRKAGMDLFGFMKRTTRWMRSYSISPVNGSYTTGYHGSLATSASLRLKFSVL